MQLKEHEHFEVQVSTSEKPGIPADAYIICNMCNKRLPLSMGSKYGSFSISNWSRHVKACILKSQQKASKVTQATLSTFLPHIANKSSQGSSHNTTIESNLEASTHVSIPGSSSGNQATLTNPPAELSSENQQDF